MFELFSLMEKDGFVKWFIELGNGDVLFAGEKGANLAEMFNLKMPVPPGFVIGSQAFAYFIEKTNIGNRVKGILNGLNFEDEAVLNSASKKIREIIGGAIVPPELENEIIDAYEILGAERGDVDEMLDGRSEIFVAVRSSLVAPISVEYSKNVNDNFLNVRGEKQLIDCYKKCLSSYFSPEAIYSRVKNSLEHNKDYLAVVVQKMINSRKSGIVFSKNPSAKNKDIVIQAIWGLGEGISFEKVKPDEYNISSDVYNFRINDVNVSEKKRAIVKGENGESVEIKLGKQESEMQVLNNYEIKRLAQLVKQFEEHREKPQAMEFAIDDKGIFIVQSRLMNDDFSEDEIEETLKSEPEGIISDVIASKPRVEVKDLMESKEILEENDEVNILNKKSKSEDAPEAIAKLSDIMDEPKKEVREVYEGVKEKVKKHDLFEDRDLEEMVLEELGADEYQPGTNEKKSETPELNDAAVPEDFE